MATTMQSTRVAILGVDVGGTFTDAVLLDGGRVRTAKVPTAARQEESVLAAARAVGAEGVERFAHGTTVATNALLERRGARTAFVANEGFEHLLHLRRQTRAHLYRLCDEHPPPLVPLERCYGVRGRIGPDGELEPLDLSTLPDVGDAEAVAVCLLFSFRDASHERAVVAELRRRHPGVHVVASHEVAPEFREYERASTTAADAYLAPVDGALPARARGRCARRRPARAARDAVVGRRRVRRRGGRASGDDPRLGTGRRRRRRGPRRAARRVRARDRVRHGRDLDRRLPAAGRPRRARRGARRRRLPDPPADRRPAHGRRRRRLARHAATPAARSASAPSRRARTPGRRATARAAAPTVTDANLLLGRLPAELPGGLVLDREAAERALGDLDPQAVIDVVNAEMLRALRVVSVERGHDPRDFALVAFGGAGPLHACALAEELDIETVLVPEAAGVLSALGLVAGDERRDRVVSYVRPLAEAGELPAEGEADLRYRGQSFELTVPLQRRPRRRVPPRARGAVRLRRPSSARSSSSPSAPPTSRRGPTSPCTQQSGYKVDGAGARRAARRDVLGARRLAAARRTTTARWCCAR